MNIGLYRSVLQLSTMGDFQGFAQALLKRRSFSTCWDLIHTFYAATSNYPGADNTLNIATTRTKDNAPLVGVVAVLYRFYLLTSCWFEKWYWYDNSWPIKRHEEVSILKPCAPALYIFGAERLRKLSTKFQPKYQSADIVNRPPIFPRWNVPTYQLCYKFSYDNKFWTVIFFAVESVSKWNNKSNIRNDTFKVKR